jgi:hypothetical protein
MHILQISMERVECIVCREVLGIYEPIVIRTSFGSRRSSLAREPLLGQAGEDLFHLDCAHESGVSAGAPNYPGVAIADDGG